MLELRIKDTKKSIIIGDNGYSLSSNNIHYIFEEYKLESLITSIENQKEKYVSDLNSTMKVFNEYVENDSFANLYKKWNDQRNITGISRTDFFFNAGYSKILDSKQFQKEYKLQINTFNSYMNAIEKDKSFIWNDEEIAELKRLYEIESDNASKREQKRQQEEIKRNELIMELVQEYLLSAKNGAEKCFCLVDDVTHRIVNREKEIQIYLNNGYMCNLEKEHTQIIFLKPCENYVYTSDFERQLTKFFIDDYNKKNPRKNQWW